MALVSIIGGYTLWPLPQGVSAAPDISNNTTFAMDAANEQCGCVLDIPRTGNLRKIGFLLQQVSSAPTNTHDVRVETIDAATGLSTGTLFGTNTNNAILLDTTGWKSVTLTADAAVTIGNRVAIIWKAPATNFGNIRLGVFNDDQMTFPYTLAAPSASAKGAQTSFICTLEYDDGVIAYVPGLWAISAITTQTWNSGTSPNRRGARFKAPGPLRLSGCDIWADMDGDFDLVFYAANGTSATTVYSGDKDVRSSTGPETHRLIFTTKPTLAAGSFYRLVVLPASATNLTTYRADFDAAKYLDALPGGQDFHWTSVNGAPSAEGDWTQVLTSRPFISLRFDQIDDGSVAAAEVSHVFM